MTGEKLRCQFYLQKKRRNCRFEAIDGRRFCGNHLHAATGEGARRVPCTIDPTHDVLETDLDAHLATCPTRLRLEKLQSQPFWRPGCNAGPSEAAVQLPGQKAAAPLSVQRAAYARNLGLPVMLDLTRRVVEAHEQACPQPGEPQELVPPGAPTEQQNKELPFSVKHARQQASIVGHMLRRGLLDGAAETAYLEFGAGAGYLSLMLAACCDARTLVLVDSGTFRLKADRGLRHLGLHRLRLGIEDLWLPGLPLFVAKGTGAKRSTAQLSHSRESPTSCGAAVGATTCSPDQPCSSSKPCSSCAANSVDVCSSSQPCRDSTTGDGSQPCSSGQPWAAFGKHLCGAATDFTLRCAQQNLQHSTGVLRGLAIATCCHHRCTWQHYVNQPFFERLGFSPEEFELISWMTGWALCGHEAPPGATTEPQAATSPCFPAADGCTDATEPDVTDGGGISRSQRIDIGQKCKALIDQGRLEWLQESGFQAESVLYVPSDVSGENRLLVATV